MSMLSRKVLATEPRLDVDPATLPDGDYRAIWGGYVVQFWIEEKCYEAKTDIGIRTMGMACRVKISNGEIEVNSMTYLRNHCLGRQPMTHDEVNAIYKSGKCPGLCMSHERLRAELTGLEIVHNDTTNEVASVLMLMDELADLWGDEAVFRRCRDRLRKLVGDR